jgi:hypothetical protein
VNRIPYRKAWEVIAYTFNGCAYCPQCADNLPTRNEQGDSPTPVFLSDEFDGHTCDTCYEVIN